MCHAATKNNDTNSTVKIKNWKMTTEKQSVKHNRLQKKIK